MPIIPTPRKREHWGSCRVEVSRRGFYSSGPYPTMEGAIEALDPFNGAIYWPLRSVWAYLGRVGAD